jgi:hypothetical protein
MTNIFPLRRDTPRPEHHGQSGLALARLQEAALGDRLIRCSRKRITEHAGRPLNDDAYGAQETVGPAFVPCPAGQADPQGVLWRAHSVDEETAAVARLAFRLARDGESHLLGGLLRQGLPTDLFNEHGDSLLMLSSGSGQSATARLLLENGADPEHRNDRGETALTVAAARGDVGIAQTLLQHGAAVNGRGQNGRTPLMLAAMFNKVHVIEVLLAGGAEAGLTDRDGVTALGLARAMDAEEAARKLNAVRQD